MKKELSKSPHRYNLASAPSRLLSRLLDLIFFIFISIGLFYLIFNNESINSFPEWKMLVFCYLLVFLLQIFFIFIPFFFAGYSIFSWIFKIRIYSINLKTISSKKWIKNLDFIFLVQLFKREAFTIEFFSIILFLLGTSSMIFPNDFKMYLNNTINLNGQISINNPIEIVFSALFSIFALVQLLVILNVIVCSGKRTFIDHISNTVVIKMVDTSGSNEPKKNVNYKNGSVKYNLPGEISIDDICNDDLRAKDGK